VDEADLRSVLSTVREFVRGQVVPAEAAQVSLSYDTGIDRKVGPAAATYFCSEMAGRVADRAVQIHGGSGSMRGVAV
jgi:acyl-CoA dehydrogenase